MNIIYALTLRHLKLNKKRTILTIIGVILSVSMITAVTTFATSFLNMLQRNAIEYSGNWHVRYMDVPSQKINLVKNDKNTSTYSLSRDTGYAILDGSKNENKPYLFLKAYDEQGFKSFNLNLVDGRFPKSSNEIVISSHIAENGGVVYKVGDVLKLDVGERYLDENGMKSLLGQDSSFVKKSSNSKSERFISKSTKEYTITGIISRPSFEPYWAPGYTVISYLNKNELTSAETVNISVVWKNLSNKANQQATELSKSLGVSIDNINYNQNLLRYYGVMEGDLLKTLYAFAAIAMGLIVISSVALIYNSFAISISERSRHLGMLASVGATKKQKRSFVFYEGFVVGIIGIPIGIIFGTLGMGVTFVLMQPFMEGIVSTGVKLILVISPIAIIAAVLLSIITIFISVYIPAKRASKISPLDAIRQSQDIKITGRTVKTSKLTRFIFGFEAELGLKNLKRNKRRYRATIFSLVISIVLFLSVSSLSFFSHKSTEIVGGIIPYDVKMFITSSETAQEKKDFYTAISKMDFADESVIEQTMIAILNVDSNLIRDEIKSILKLNNIEENGKTYEAFFQIKSIDEVALNRYAKENGADIVRLKDAKNPCGILVNKLNVISENKYLQMKHFNIEPGEKLKFTQIDGGASENSSVLEITAFADKTPIGETEIMMNDNLQGTLIVSEEVFASILAKQPKRSDNTNVEMEIKSSNPTSLVESIKEYQKQTSITNVNIYDVAMSNKQTRQRDTLVYVFFYGFVALITAICIANILNTISTSIALRKREFAMLKSIGMTPKGFNKMINYESLFYGIKALLYGLPISFGIMYLIYKVLSNSFGFPFAIPWGSVLAVVVAVFAIVSSTMLYASSKIKKENVIDILKNENI